MYGDVVLHVPREEFNKVLNAKKAERKVASDTDLTAADLKDVVRQDEEIVRRHTGGHFPDDPKDAALGRDRRRLQVLGQRAGQDLPQAPPHPGGLGHRRQRPGDGLRQPRRNFRHGRCLHARPLDRREALLRRVPAQRPGRGRRGRHPDAAASRPGRVGRSRSKRRCRRPTRSCSRAGPARESRSATCRTSSSRSKTGSSTFSRRATGSAPALPPCASRRRWSRRA